MLFKCPICGKEVLKPSSDGDVLDSARAFFPFCCQRCRLVDLGCWLDSEYAVECGDDFEADDKLQQ